MKNKMFLSDAALAIVVNFGRGSAPDADDYADSEIAPPPAEFTAEEQNEVISLVAAEFESSHILVVASAADLPAGTEYLTIHVSSAEPNSLADAAAGSGSERTVFTSRDATVSSVADLIAGTVEALTGSSVESGFTATSLSKAGLSTTSPAAISLTVAGGISALAVPVDPTIAGFVNPSWTNAGNTPATYYDPYTGQTISLTYGVNAFSSVGNAKVAGKSTIYVTNYGSTNIYADGRPLIVNGGSSMNIYGGGDAGTSVSGDTNIIYNGGSASVVYVGGRSNLVSSSTVGGNTNITVNGGSITTLYGGGNASTGSAYIGQNVNISIAGGTVGTLYGGGRSSRVLGNVNIEVTGGTVGTLYGGGNGAGVGYVAVYGYIDITIAGDANITGMVYGGGSGNRSYPNGSIYITIADNAFIGGGVQGAGTVSTSAAIYVTLAGGTVSGTVDLSTNATSNYREVEVTGYAVVDNLIGATAITVQNGAFLFCDTGLTNSSNGRLTVFATSGLSVDVDGSFNNQGNVYIDCSGFLFEDYQYQVKLIETNAWNGNTSPSNIIIQNYAGSRNVDYLFIGGDLYLVDINGAIFVNSTYSSATTGTTYTDPFNGRSTDLSFGDNAYNSIASGISGSPNAFLIYITGGTSSGTSYCEGVMTVMNDGYVQTLYGGNSGNLTLAEGTNISLTIMGGTVDTLYGGCAGNLTGETKITIAGGTVTTAYAGGAGDVYAWTNITIMGGTVGTVYGGGVGYSEETYVSFTGGTVGTIYGGSQNGDVAGHSYIDVGGGDAGAHVTGNVYGGCQNGTVSGNAYLYFYGGTIDGSVYADYNIAGDSVSLFITEGLTVVNGVIEGLTSLRFASGAQLEVNSGWTNNGTTHMFAENQTLLRVTGAYANAGTVTVDASGFSMNAGLDLVQLISATSFGNSGGYAFQNGEIYYDAGDSKRYVLATTGTGLYIVTQSATAYVSSNWARTADSPIIYDGADGVGYYEVNAFNTVSSAATNGYFSKLYVEGGTFAGGEFLGLATVIQSGAELGTATSFTAHLYGGSTNAATLAATTDLTINGGDFGKKNVFAGNAIAAASGLDVVSSLTVNGGSNFNVLVGGNQITAATTLTAASSLSVNIGTATAAMVLGGNQIATGSAATLSISGNCTTSVGSGSFSSFIIGADYVSSGSVVHTGSISLSISGGTFSNLVAGGLCFRGASDQSAAISGDVSLVITGGTFLKNIYAGNLASDSASSANTTVTGNTSLVLDASAGTIRISGNVYAGSYGSGMIDGDTSVTVSGLGENLLFSGVLSGASQEAYCIGDRHIESNYTTYVTGKKTLIFDDFTGSFNAAAVAFNIITVTGSSAVTIASSNTCLASASAWNFDLGSSVLWNAGANDFAGDTLNFDFDSADWNGSGWEVLTSANSVAFTGWNDSGNTVYIGGELASWSDPLAGWATGSHKLTLEAAGGSQMLLISNIA